MGDFRITIEGAGNHGCGREAKDGETVKRCGYPGCVDCAAVELVNQLKAQGALSGQGIAILEHWPVPGAAGSIRTEKPGPIDDLVTGKRSGSF
jgi:hypothetical protein